MTVLNLAVFPERIVVATDTYCDFQSLGGSRQVHASKMVLMPHWPGVIAARGDMRLTVGIGGAALMLPDLDAFLDSLTELANGVMATQKALSPYPPAAEMEIAIAGWAPEDQELVAYHAKRGNEGGFELAHIGEGGVFSPIPFADGHLPDRPETVADHVAVARPQVRRLLDAGALGAGGDLCIATVTRLTVSVEVVRDFTGEAAGTPRIGGKALAAV